MVQNEAMTGEHQITASISRFPCHRRTMIDSSGLGSLVRAFTSIHTQGGELKLLNLTNKVQDVWKLQSCIPSSTL